MREIKFRAWLGKEERMYDPMRLHFVPDGRLLVEVPNWLTMWEYPEDVKLMQFTGLKDKNGKEIYEDDLVEWKQANGGVLPSDTKTYICQIIWEFEGWVCKHVSSDSRFTFATCHLNKIGNIYENPELLKETK